MQFKIGHVTIAIWLLGEKDMLQVYFHAQIVEARWQYCVAFVRKKWHEHICYCPSADILSPKCLLTVQLSQSYGIKSDAWVKYTNELRDTRWQRCIFIIRCHGAHWSKISIHISIYTLSKEKLTEQLKVVVWMILSPLMILWNKGKRVEIPSHPLDVDVNNKQ